MEDKEEQKIEEIQNTSFKGGQQIKDMLDDVWNTPSIFKTGKDMVTSFIDTRQQAIDMTAQAADTVVTGGLKKINMPGAEFIGDRARNITGFAADIATPEAWELPFYGAATAEPTPFGEGAVYGLGMSKRLMVAQAKAHAALMEKAPQMLDWVFSSSNNLFNKGNPNWRAVTPDGVPIDGSMMMSKSDDALGGFSKNIRKTSPEYENIVLSGMERMGMKDGVFDINLYNKNSPILNEMSDPLGGTVMKSGMRRGKKLSKRNWMEYFLSPESLKGNFESLRKSGKVAADLEWGDFLKSKGLKIQDIQAHHINPLYDSMHLFHGVKWGSDEYWDIVSTLINRGARPGVVQRGNDITNIVRTFGKSSLTDTPHGIAHEFYRDIKKVFFSEKEIDRLANPNGFIDETGKFWKPQEYRRYKTKTWAKIVKRSEEILIETHKAWKSLNPKTRMDFNELVETMSKYDNKGIIKGIHEKYQVKDIKKMVSEINEAMILEPLPTRKFKNVDEVKQRMILYKSQPGVTWKMVKKKFPGFNYEQLDLFD